MRNYLGATERADYERCPPRTRRQWLLGRIAAKDAVRRLLWEDGAGAIFPAEVEVFSDDSGQIWARGKHGRRLPNLILSIGHCAEVGVAIARRSGETLRVGIDVEEVITRTAAMGGFPLSRAEADLLASVSGGADESLWRTQFWAAKEAVAKAEAAGRPREFAIVDATATEVVVAADQRVYRVSCTQIRNPDDLSPRRYVVAWTSGPTTENEEESR
jgi:4'-phosphopantetheinyl transferase EntD